MRQLTVPKAIKRNGGCRNNRPDREDIEIDEIDGAVYTTNSHFPTWQSEGGVPTLLRIRPLAK